MDWENDGRGLTRRSALYHSAGAVALVCSFDFDKRARATRGKTSAALRSQASGVFEPFQRDLPVPPVARPVNATKKLEE